jgi:hypothetical protein
MTHGYHSWEEMLSQNVMESFAGPHNSKVLESAYMPFSQWKGKVNLIYLHNGELFRNNEEWNIAFAGKWVEVDVSMLSTANHVQKDRHHIFSHMLNLVLKYIERYTCIHT